MYDYGRIDSIESNYKPVTHFDYIPLFPFITDIDEIEDAKDPERAFRRKYGSAPFSSVKDQQNLLDEQRKRYMADQRKKVEELHKKAMDMRQKLVDTYPVIAEKLNAISSQTVRKQVQGLSDAMM